MAKALASSMVASLGRLSKGLGCPPWRHALLNWPYSPYFICGSNWCRFKGRIGLVLYQWAGSETILPYWYNHADAWGFTWEQNYLSIWERA